VDADLPCDNPATHRDAIKRIFCEKKKKQDFYLHFKVFTTERIGAGESLKRLSAKTELAGMELDASHLIGQGATA
jgi:hypothetical protein